MCGVVGVAGVGDAQKEILGMLTNLEYRGYDSSGMAVLSNGRLHVVKRQGALSELKKELAKPSVPLHGSSGIGHTRWATHGAPSDINAHPHLSSDGKVAIVHNGIIENYKPIKEQLLDDGYVFQSETDSEVIANLAAKLYQECGAGSYRQVLSRLQSRLVGAYAVVIQFADAPDLIGGIRNECPLNYIQNDGQSAISSDLSSLVSYGRDVFCLKDKQCVILGNEGVEVFDESGAESEAIAITINWSVEKARKDGYDTFLQKEIHEEPAAAQAFCREIRNHRAALDAYLKQHSFTKIVVVACGSASFSAIFAEALARQFELPVDVISEVGSEMRYNPPIISSTTLVLAISQSGETADTIGAVKAAKQKGAQVVAFVNVAGSTLEFVSDLVLPLSAGPEISVPSTKTVTNMFLAVYFFLDAMRQALSGARDESWFTSAEDFRAALAEMVGREREFRSIADRISGYQSCFAIGRGVDFSIAKETALKFKETSYLHCEAMNAGEFKHGSISLIEYGMPVLCILTDQAQRKKMVSNINEVRARGAQCIVISDLQPTEIEDAEAMTVITVPAVGPVWNTILTLVVAHYISFLIGTLRGIDVDRPRNLAKSVTVE
ncbi:glucosamine--fructose-6-phosphate aminotransferase (isomerizing) (plasmid) [Ruegeria pomeroyi DSS-3]|uniref:Glutamine--fructose-6-phosphate aminotransferase [isomerizing] n=2 Tax=Ruegeria pomeroyi TaxID=89184 RepID=Q5LL87_RUEPO|nr:glutamine--fructose-6-phosphate transaminase (isomerizing) [Ruegeria pomeroyi]AAV97276.1 glucosamine--fructose-6-phosphate aminotransferase (isomerizing) [Ruegeria pomeroyi DSS-3]NVK99648.1 glutamine--fructose-6-phosphate transaminase (isomerizing) [Ruegeria pomeroyi]NVK99965.1 glutamine--fructose-6-phosphate transaminase (isomerizing) [Ruegeria pomeroyi]